MNELRRALRRIRSSPARFAAGALTLGLGIGASTAAFGAVEGVLLSPLPVADQARVVVVWHLSPERDFAHVPFRPEGVEALAEGVAAFSGVSGVETVGPRAVIAEGDAGPHRVEHVRVVGDFFGVLGVTPVAGRLLDEDDDAAGSEPVAVVSHAYWTRRAGREMATLLLAAAAAAAAAAPPAARAMRSDPARALEAE